MLPRSFLRSTVSRSAGIPVTRRWKGTRSAPKVLSSPIENWDQPPILVPVVDDAADDRELMTAEEERELAQSLPASTATATTLPLNAAVLPPSVRPSLDYYRNAPRKQPTVTGWVDATNPAYDDQLWTREEDALIGRVVTETPEGLARNWNQVAALYFPHRSPRTLRLRWETYLKPTRIARDPRTMEARQFRKAHGDALTVVAGRWCAVPLGRPTPQPYEAKLDMESQPLSSLHLHSSTSSDKKDSSAEATTFHDLASAGLRSHAHVGLTSYDYAVQAATEAEQVRRNALAANPPLKREIALRKRQGHVVLEEVEWLPEEDMVLREGLELFGNDWERISRGLKARRRSPQECRERMEQLSSANKLQQVHKEESVEMESRMTAA